jgi:hypothetical protein
MRQSLIMKFVVIWFLSVLISTPVLVLKWLLVRWTFNVCSLGPLNSDAAAHDPVFFSLEIPIPILVDIICCIV